MSQIYVNTAKVLAHPMTRLVYNKLRGWELPEDENGADEGFLLEHLNSVTTNHPDFDHYINWVPKEEFEANYAPVNN